MIVTDGVKKIRCRRDLMLECSGFVSLGPESMPDPRVLI